MKEWRGEKREEERRGESENEERLKKEKGINVNNYSPQRPVGAVLNECISK
jgi:hypothetical protein